MIEIKRVTGDKKPFNPKGIYYGIFVNGNLKKKIPKNNLGAEIESAENNRKMYQNKADEHMEIRDKLKQYKE